MSHSQQVSSSRVRKEGLFLKNSRGQMAVFIALIFQVLFVFFAMSINVALVVHDKINLQNSVDLGAYYGAQKQAELLNTIAHMNYQIRQAYKLLAWRSRVVGTLGNGTHPTRPSQSKAEAPFFPTGQVPALCVNWCSVWDATHCSQSGGGQNLCSRGHYYTTPTIPRFSKILAPFNPINFLTQRRIDNLISKIGKACGVQASQNYFYALSIATSYRLDQMNRREVIRKLADNLSKSDFLDLDGNSVRTGVQAVVYKNLTHGNKDFGSLNIQVLNSLRRTPSKAWLPTVFTFPPDLHFLDAVEKNAGGQCSLSIKSYRGTPQPINPGSRSAFNSAVPAAYRSLFEGAPHRANSEKFQYSLGVEKNPWYAVYVGVRAATKTRQLFFPFGKYITLRAKAYAKPFGGRVGPWYSQAWPRAAPQSTGAPVDPLVLPRWLPGAQVDPNRAANFSPNYSRFPGDRLGLNSRLAQAAIIGASANRSYKMTHFLNIANPNNIQGELPPTDFLSGHPRENQSPRSRLLELRAIAPDLFDVSYYSIEPNFHLKFLRRLQARASKFGIDLKQTAIRGDLGYHPPYKTYGSIETQVTGAYPKNRTEAFRKGVFYKVKNIDHTLTAWLPNSIDKPFDVFVSQSPSLKRIPEFGNCSRRRPASSQLPYPSGGCLAGGGRTGYSVKLVSGPFLNTGDHLNLGGAGGGGLIKNSPQSYGW